MPIGLPIVSKFDDKGVKQAESSLDQLQGVAKSLGLVVAAAFAVATAAAVDFGIKAVKAASDLSETSAAVGQVFGDAAKTLEEFAKTAPAALGQTQNQFLGAAKTFGIFGKAAGLADDANAEFSKSLSILATDLASFNNTSVDEAITAIGAGLRGENEPLRRFGVLLDDATLKARAMEMGIYDGNGALNAQQKVLAANAEIFAQTITQQGDFARTSDGVANASRTLTAVWTDMQAVVGTALLPTVQAILPQFTEFINQMVASPEFNQFLADMATNFSTILEWLPGALSNLQSFGKDALPAVNSFFPMVNDALALLAALFLDISNTDPSTNTKTFAGSMKELAASFTDIGNALKWIKTQWDALPSFFKMNFFEVTRVLLAAPFNGFQEFGAILSNEPYRQFSKDAQGRNILIPGQANGGVTTQGGLSWVGERGPELLNLPTGAQVIPLSKMGGASGGNTITINVSAGMGADGAAIGEQIVTAIRKYERTSGAVFAKA